MNIQLKVTDATKLDVDALCVFVGQDHLDTLASLNEKLSGILFSVLKKEGFTGKKDQLVSLHTHNRIAPYKVILLGLGKKEECDSHRIRTAVSQGINEVKRIQSQRCAIDMPVEFLKGSDISRAFQAIVEAVLISTYEFGKYKSTQDEEKKPKLTTVYLHVLPRYLEIAEGAVHVGTIFAHAICQARDLVNEPSDVTTPTHLAKTAEAIAKKYPREIRVKIIEKEEAQKLGMGAYLGVAKGSVEPPKFIHLTYTPKRSKGKVVLVGKGITFDTGGVSLKPPEHMETMKLDMAGGAAVLSVFTYLPELDVSYTVDGIIAACENMPSGSALKPGDIVTALNGKTIEVLNTDAEGRLTLADAFSYALKFVKPDYMIDLATLTGACMVALGQDIAGLWSNSEKLKKALIQSSLVSGEKIWDMPLPDQYRELIKSPIADLKNIQTGRYGGAVTAALFLEEFVGNVPWAHLDIAGPAFAEKDSTLIPKGGTGFGVALILTFLLGL